MGLKKKLQKKENKEVFTIGLTDEGRAALGLEPRKSVVEIQTDYDVSADLLAKMQALLLKR